jgi:hypothetical protein
MVMIITALMLVLDILPLLLRRDRLPTGLDDGLRFGISLVAHCVLSIFGEVTVDDRLDTIGHPGSVDGGGGHGRRNVVRITHCGLVRCGKAPFVILGCRGGWATKSER